MEANLCDVNHLDSDVLLPPRKRLLAGLKKQIADGNPYLNGNSHTLLPSSSSSEFDGRLSHLLRFQLGNPNIPNEEMVEASRLAAVEAVKVAEAARAAADEKAAIAAKAMAAAKSALESVAAVSDEKGSSGRVLRKNKTKKHVPVQMLYKNKHKGRAENCKTDEELARKLHRAINSSPRISKNSSSSDSKSHRYKRLKSSSSSEKIRVFNGSRVLEAKPPSNSNGNGLAGNMNSDSSIHVAYPVRVDENISKFSKAKQLKMDNGKVGPSHLTEKFEGPSHLKEKFEEAMDDMCSIGRKRGRIKQKKLPLSICNGRDQVNPREDLKSRKSSLSAENISKSSTVDRPMLSVGPSAHSVLAVERTPSWKCQAFKEPVGVKQNKVTQP